MRMIGCLVSFVLATASIRRTAIVARKSAFETRSCHCVRHIQDIDQEAPEGLLMACIGVSRRKTSVGRFVFLVLAESSLPYPTYFSSYLRF